MNDKGLIRQFIMLAVVLLIAVFVSTQIEWNDVTVTPLITQSVNGGAGSSPGEPDGDARLTRNDLRGGGVSRRFSSGGRAPAIRSGTASSTPFAAATSTSLGKKVEPGGVNGPLPSGNEWTVPGRARTTVLNRPTGVEREIATGTKEPAPAATGREGDDGSQDAQDDASSEAQEQPGNAYPEVISDLKISGHVLNDLGEPIAGLGLTLKLRRARGDEAKALQAYMLNTASDEKGAYQFVNLVEGDYQICTAGNGSYRTSCQSVRAPHAATDFSLQGTSSGKVYGVVRDEQGKPLAGVSISAVPGQRQRTESDAKGRFSLPMDVNMRTSYQVYLALDDYVRKRIPLKGSDILGGRKLEVKLTRVDNSGIDVSGTIYDGSGSPLKGRTVTLYSPRTRSQVALRAVSDADGRFTIRSVPAAEDYRLNVNTGGGYSFDPKPWSKLKVYQGMAPLQIQLQSAGKGSLSARVVSASGEPLTGVSFTLYSGSSYAGRSISSDNGEIEFDNVPVKPGGSSLRITGGSSPRYSFSGIKLAESEHMSGLLLLVDRGLNTLVVTIKDELGTPLKGARGVLIWSRTENGVVSQTSRSRGKVSMEETGIIRFSELSLGEHTLQVRLDGYLPVSKAINVFQQEQYETVVLVKKDKGS